ncbi:MAG: YicC family protein [Lachnospiraceae bacterium]|nr:YicC family protein [Lachnospiraceae bacterium]
MAYSMTGFGHYEFTSGSKKVLCSIKSVNHRYLDLNIKLPRKLSVFEGEIRNIIKNNISRGKVDIAFSYEEGCDKEYDITYNSAVVSAYIDGAAKMAADFGLVNNLSTSDIISLPDVFEIAEKSEDEDELKNMTLEALKGAVSEFKKARADEGNRLAGDLIQKLDELYDDVLFVEERSPKIVEEYKTALTARIQELLGDVSVDESRIATEVTIFADKICVDEEIVRLKSHISEAKKALSSEDTIGRKLDFIAQEMNRESNTILSKTSDAEISNKGIFMKTNVEKIREQIQNLE